MTAHKHKAKSHHAHTPPHHHAEQKKEKKTNILSWVVSAVILFGLLFAAANYAVSDNTMTTESSDQTTKDSQSTSISNEERDRIDQWILKNNLNQYGDTKDTVYLGGTPLFNESTGSYKNLYEYIFERHPEHPWNK